MLTVSPAYGRDYKSAKAAIEDWKSGKDFVIEDVFSPYCGQYVNINDYSDPVKIRFDRMRKVCVA